MAQEVLFKVFLDKALKFLSFRPRSRNEILKYLEAKAKQSGKGKLLKNQVLKKLEAMGLVNDREFAAWLIEQRQSNRSPKGWAAVRGELLAKGVPRDLVAQLSRRPTDGDFEANVFSYLGRKERRLNFASKYERRRRLVESLWRRGFGYEAAQSLVDKYLAKD